MKALNNVHMFSIDGGDVSYGVINVLLMNENMDKW